MSDPFSTDLNLSESEVDKLIRERNALQDKWYAEHVRASVLERALREIAEMVPNAGSENQPVYIARRALDGKEEE